MATNCDNHFFCSEVKKNCLFPITFVFLANISVLLLVLITIRLITVLFYSFGGNPRWPIQGIHHLAIMSHDVITARCKPQRKHVYKYHVSYRPLYHIHRFYSCEVMKGGEVRGRIALPPAPSFKRQKKPE